MTDVNNGAARRTASMLSVNSSMGDAGADQPNRVNSASSLTSRNSFFSDDSDETNADYYNLMLSSVSNQSINSSIVSHIGEQKVYEWRETFRSWRKFDEFRKQNLFCDLELVVDGRAFNCHRAVLSASCQYFAALLNGKWKNGQAREIIIPGVSAQMMEILINYMYTKEVRVTQSNVEELLPASDQ